MTAFRANPDNTLGKHRLIAELGHGGMADVFLGVSQGMGGFHKLLVIKQLRPNLADDAEFLAMFLDEARLAARLSHRNVVQTFEVGEDDGRYFIAMEHLEGQSLRRIVHRCRGDRFALSMHLRVISDALAGLHHAHELRNYDGAPLGVVHRDVSPHNVFVCYDGLVKVVDFGIAKALDSTTQTSVGVMKGKLAYMAPEQARGERVDRRADVFAAGILLWEAIAGRRMWEGETALSVTDLLVSGDVPSLAEHAPNAPAPLVEICNRAVSVAPENRYQTAAQFRDALEAFLVETYPPVTPEALGARVAELFSDDRILMQAIVERQLKRLKAGGVSEGSLPSVSRVTSMIGTSSRGADSTPSTSGSRSRTTGMAAGSVQGVPPAQAQSQRPATSWTRFAWLAAALAAGVFIGGMAFWARVGPFALVPPPGNVAAAGEPASDQGIPQDTPKLIELYIRVDPLQARLFVDGEPLSGNPFRGTFPADEALHEVRAEAPGFVPRNHSITFAANAHIELGLERESLVPADSYAAPTASLAPAKAPPLPARPRPPPKQDAGAP